MPILDDNKIVVIDKEEVALLISPEYDGQMNWRYILPEAEEVQDNDHVMFLVGLTEIMSKDEDMVQMAIDIGREIIHPTKNRQGKLGRPSHLKLVDN